MVKTDGAVHNSFCIFVTLTIFEERFGGDFPQIDGIFEGERLVGARLNRVNASGSDGGVASESVFGTVNFYTRVVDSEANEISTSGIAGLLDVVKVDYYLHSFLI